MITVKLGNYSHEEVNLLIQAIEKALVVFGKYANPICCKMDDCNPCNLKHVCYDIHKIYDYLTLEADYSYPHSKK